MLTANKTTLYPDGYKEDAYQTWFALGQITASSLIPHLLLFNNSRPNINTIHKWINDDWKEKAKKDNEIIRMGMVENVIITKYDMQLRHIEIAKVVQKKALDWLKDNHIKNARDAISLLKLGLEWEESSVSVGKLLQDVGKMQDSKLMEKIQGLLSKADIKKVDGQSTNKLG